jgi:hypothetical protein
MRGPHAVKRGTDTVSDSMTRRKWLPAIAVLAMSCGLCAWAPVALAAFGDNYSFTDVNDGALGSAQESAAFPNLSPDPAADKAFWAGTCDLSSTATDVGVAPAARRHCIDWGQPNATTLGLDSWTTTPAWRLAVVGSAGTRPDGTATMAIKRNGDEETITYPDGSVDNIRVDLPSGFVGNPTALAKCTAEQFAVKPNQCPPASQAGIADIGVKQELLGGLTQGIYPVFNLEPRQGYTAEFGIPDVATFVSVRIVAEARTSSDFGVTAMVTQIPAALPLLQQSVTLWGVPWAAEHDKWRLKTGEDQAPDKGLLPAAGLDPEDQAPYQPSWGPIKPFFANITACDGAQPTTSAALDTFQRPGAWTSFGQPDFAAPTNWVTAASPSPAVDECEKPPFDPAVDYTDSTQPDSPLGLSADVEVPQNNDPPADVASDPSDVDGAPAFWRSDAGRATSHLDKTVVTLPEGFSVNPSGAAGLKGCSDSQIGLRQLGNPPLFNNGDPFDGDAGDGVECPAGSIIGTAEVVTPLLDDPLTGQVVLGQPKAADVDCPGEPGVRRANCRLGVRMFIVVRDPDRGLVAKIYGSAVTDPSTGRLTATFDKNPKVPFDSVHLEFKGGQRGLVATPTTCGTRQISSVFTPWTATHGAGGLVDTVVDDIAVAGQCQRPVSAGMKAGVSSRTGGGSGTFSFTLTRPDRSQGLFRGLSVRLPTGLLAAVRDVPLCTNAQASANACPPASRIGTVDAGAGAGLPFFLEKKGTAYLTEGYKGAPYGMAVSVPVEAGPFRGAFALTPIVVRQALHVDRTTAQVTAVSDPLPQIHHGIPLRVREATVKVDRGGFIRNPSDCSAKRIAATLRTNEGGVANLSQPFQVADCARLGFRPKLGLQLTGRRQVVTGRHPGVKAVVTQTSGQAGVRKAVVRLPLSLALDPDNAQALCEYDDGIKPDLENHCPKGSIVGRARAVSPLLKKPLAGDVYFVKNVKFGANGNRIATLPMIVVALRGEIAVNLRGVSSTTPRGKLVNTFDAVPDAPVSQFNLNIKGGDKGILTVTRTRRAKINICRGRHVAEADFDGQNGRQHDRDIRVKTPRCSKKKASSRKGG